MTTQLAAPSDDDNPDDGSRVTDADWLARLANPAAREDAAQMIFQKYADQLLNLIRINLSESLHRRAEPQDIMQSVWKSFFARTFELHDTDSLFPLLAEMCIRKASSAARRHTALMRSTDSEVSRDAEGISDGVRPSSQSRKKRLSGPAGDKATPANDPANVASKDSAPNDDDSNIDLTTRQMMVNGATPEQAAIAIELFESLPATLQEIMRLRLEGFHDEDIAKKLRCTRRTVVRKTDLIRRHLRDRVGPDERPKP